MVGAPPAGGGIQIPGRAEANGLAVRYGRRHPCHGAVAVSLGPIAIEIPQLQYIDQVVDVLVAQVQQIRALSWETVEIPQLLLVTFWTRSLTCPLCATTGAVWSMFWRSSSTRYGRPCDHAWQWKCPRFSSSRNWWTFQLATETGARLSAVAAMMGF